MFLNIIKFTIFLREKCPLECERKYWEVNTISAEVENKVKKIKGLHGKDVLTIKWEKVQILDNSEDLAVFIV